MISVRAGAVKNTRSAASIKDKWLRAPTHRRLNQARALFALFPDLDRVYLGKRIRYESAGDHGLEIRN